MTFRPLLISMLLFVNSIVISQQSHTVIFRIQIGTSAKMPDENSKFKKDFTVAEGVRLEDGLIRVYVGSFETYNEAKLQLQAAKDKGYPTAYVVAFHEGKRISVDKAIDIIYGD